ncbi:U6 snRNP-associated protein Lsm7 [Dimargaris cristalligena]|uniref:Sm domain-containing protein n=2 Tax=Zoopagomycota TaxID=1913638 RepID=A0A4V1J572_9FUNG|nr:U6 snRNP-associated protein Lsm7 [Dimargaris cristalligena]RKP25942.1 hypothetical protein SYNPS1DRAFT_28340 [Syncephalis pseudoplumigaleata]RKP38049.1 hypothetical protein BJ085DRAFT_19788 [Dimargaris cristalligena]|eukprot:RKP25942.1 hypothetical protein SYNPS1DRAFT_28340 [Syncephalis pseudoplumigaleata]
MRGGGNSQGGRDGGEKRGKRNPILDLSKYSDKKITVKFMGGREVTGLLKGYDQLLNLVLDQAEEVIKAPEGEESAEPQVRQIGLMVCRGPAVITIAPVDGSSMIANPFLAAEQ